MSKMRDGGGRYAKDPSLPQRDADAQGSHVISIPGTRSVAHLRENLATLDLDITAEALAAAGEVLNASTVHGPRWNATTLAEIDTERCGRAG